MSDTAPQLRLELTAIYQAFVFVISLITGFVTRDTAPFVLAALSVPMIPILMRAAQQVENYAAREMAIEKDFLAAWEDRASLNGRNRELLDELDRLLEEGYE